MQSNTDTFLKVRQFYDTHAEELSFKKRFHYYSRLHLFFKQERYGQLLQGLRSDWDVYVTGVIAEINEADPRAAGIGSLSARKQYQLPYKERYPELTLYTKILFCHLFDEVIYQQERPDVTSILSTDGFAETFRTLTADTEALLYLSTPAVNFLYRVAHVAKHEACTVSADHFLQVLRSVPQQYDIASELLSRIYFGTHVIVNASNFYHDHITEDRDVYQAILAEVETLIDTHYDSINLDQKFEFLVCARLLGVTSPLSDRIRQEAEQSWSPRGDFLINSINTHAKDPTKVSFGTVEHSNVLAIMAFVSEM